MKKITPIEIFITVIFLICLSFYVIPKITLSLEQKQYGRIQTNAAMMKSKILAEFSDKNNKKTPTEISNMIADEMNKLVKNPIDKKNPAYSVNKECRGCIVVTPDDKIKSVILTAKDSDGKLITRTVIQPPSFVTFNEELDK